MARGRASFVADTTTMLAMAGLAGAFVLWHQSKKKGSPVIQGRPRFGEPPLRYTQHFDRRAIVPGDRVRFKYMENFKIRQHTGTVIETNGRQLTVRAKAGSRAPEIDYSVDIEQLSHKELPKIGHVYGPQSTAPGLIGCDCGTEF